MRIAQSARTVPTAKPSVAMNRKNLRVWELNLGPSQVVILVGLITGSMACAFFLGYFSGQRSGFEAAREFDIVNASRIPITEDLATSELSEESVSKMYAKLSDSAAIAVIDQVKEGNKSKDAAALAPIPTTKDAPIAAVLPESAPPPEVVGAVEAEVVKQAKNERIIDSILEQAKSTHVEEPGIRVLGGGAAEGDTVMAKTATTDGILNEKTVEFKAEQVDELVENIAVVDQQPPTAAIKTAEKPTVEKIAIAEEEQIEPKEVKTEIAPKSSTKRGWYAQVAAPRRQQDADRVAKDLRSSGFPVVIERTEIRGQEYFRILVGPENSRELGERMVQQLSRERYLQGTPFLKEVQ